MADLINLAEDSYMLRRLSEVRRAQELPASARLDLAASPLSDDELEDSLQPFGAEYNKAGWGMSTMFDSLLSRDPKSVKVSDLTHLQTSLKDQGYVRPDTPVDGAWSPLWSSSFRRWDRDNEEQVRSGKHWLAAPVQTGLEAIGNTLPSAVFQGIIGSAKGFVEQAPETAERAGALGGAVAGAAIGTAIAPGLGTLIGAGAGGAIGFAADFFGDDEGEEGQSVDEKFKDALTPFEEYKAQGSKAFFEDLGWVITAASLIRGGMMAAQGVKAGVGAIAAKGALTKTVSAQPGIMARVVGAGMNKAGMSNASSTFLNVAKNHGLMAQASRPLLQTVNGGFTGLAAGQIGARYASGLGSGKDTTTIEGEIEKAPKLPTWVDDSLGLLVFSNKFLPIESGAVGRTARKALGDVTLFPYVHTAQSAKTAEGKVASIAEAREAARNVLGRDDLERATTDIGLRLDYGVQRRAGEMVASLGRTSDDLEFERDFQKALFSIKRTVKDEWANGTYDTSRELLGYSHWTAHPADTANGPMAFTGWLQDLTGKGSGLDQLADYKRGQELLTKIQRNHDTGNIGLEIAEGTEGTVQDATKLFRERAPDFDRAAAVREVNTLKEQAGKLEARAAKVSDPMQATELKDQARQLRTQAQEMRKALPKPKNIKRDRPYSVTLMRKHDPDNFVPGGLSEQDLLGLADEYDALAFKVRGAYKAAGSPEANKTYQLAQEEMNTFAQDLHFRGAIRDKDLGMAQRAEPSAAVSNRLRKRSKFHAKEIRVDDPRAAEIDKLGYKLVATRDDVIMYDELDKARRLMEIQGVGDYTRRAALFETIGLSPRKHTDRSLFRLRQGHESNELSGALQEEGVRMTGQTAIRKLHGYLNDVKNGDEGVVVGPGIFKKDLSKQKGFSYNLYKVDVRELSPDDISEALKLDSFKSVTDPEAASRNIYDAMKRGAALGGETDGALRHPVDAARMLGRAMRVNGLPGFSDWMRTFHVKDPRRTGAVLGGALGAGIAAEDEDAGLFDVLKGGAVGAAAGASLGALLRHKFPKGTYGYLPDHLHRVNMALRYSFSPAFDAGRYMEQNMLAIEHGLPAIVRPQHYIKKRFGDNAWDEALSVWDEVNGFQKGKGFLRVIDDTDRRMFQKGVLGFSPRYHEAAQMYLLRKQGKTNRQIEEIVSKIGRYGVGRAAAEKSLNFVFFPFSFQKKLVESLGGFMMQAPGRALLIHEGLRRFHESSTDERLEGLVDQYLPFIEQIKRVNNLAYGVSPGRFFLQGVKDNKAGVAKAAQILTSAFVPSGAATPIAQTAGGLADYAVHLFVPTAVTGTDDIDGLEDISQRYIPAMRDVESWLTAGKDQVRALREGGGEYYQFQNYLDESRYIKSDIEPVAVALGYANADSFLQSDMGAAFQAQVDQREQDLRNKYPTGFAMSQEFTNTGALNEQALANLADDDDRTAEEEDLLRLAEMEQTGKLIASVAGLTMEQGTSLVAPQIRQFALKRAKNKRFQSLYERFFESTYGPILRVAV